MPEIVISDEFTGVMRSKPPHLIGAIAKCVKMLGTNPRHRSLQTHVVHGTKNPKVFEAYVDMKNRVTWHWGDGDSIVLLTNCNHDILKRPYG
jgi:hypothetical protein